ncbi:MAG: aconitate hydratase AcnA [Proteobacteria bacterium]|nr:aconitate hydratase AcnA [Pseudomonadota bacterium]
MSASSRDSFHSKATIAIGDRQIAIYRLDALSKAGIGDVATLPYSLRVLLENLLRNEDGITVTPSDIEAVATWDPGATPSQEVAFRPSRVVMQDFTGVPAVLDLAAMRDAWVEMGHPAGDLNPVAPSDLVIDHSVQVDSYGALTSFGKNVELEYRRNRERYVFLRWGQQAFKDMRVVPPGTGIVHQVNLEYLAKVVFTRERDGTTLAYPDTLVGTDSHTTMINGLGVMGWGVGGIEAEAAMLGQPIPMLVPQVVGFKLEGKLPEGATATDLVLTVVEMLRKRGVVGKFVEFYGNGLDHLSLPDRATIANMAPEYGATMGFFPIDDETLDYLRFTGRDPSHVELVERYLKEQGLFRTPGAPEPRFSDTLALDLATVVPSIAGPKRPQDRIPLSAARPAWKKALGALLGSQTEATDEQRRASAAVKTDRGDFELANGHVIIAAITSCTNTSNPSVMVAAGLLARKARARGLTTRPWVKTSLAPGSQVVTEYLKKVDLMEDLESLGFHLVGYGCTTCIGNSGPVHENIAAAVKQNDLVVTSVLSGNRNFEGRISPVVRANYLASPPLVVAYALAGTLDIDLENDPIGTDSDGKSVYLRDVWPSPDEVTDCIRAAVKSEMFEERYGHVFEGTESWRAMAVPEGDAYTWDNASTYVRKPPFFADIKPEVDAPRDIRGARVLAMLGDTVTTDHISPAGPIAADSPAGRYLQEQGVKPADFNSYGTRRGNHEVMMRGTFGNIRLRNLLAPGTEGGITRHLPGGDQMSIYDAAMKYQADGVPLIVLAGVEYGTGSSRDWAAKGTLLLGVSAVIAGSFERIHRSNLIGMGVLPLEFAPGESRESLGLTGEETYDITGINDGLSAKKELTVRAGKKTFKVIARLDTPQEIEYYNHGGILRYVLRTKAKSAR